MKGGQDRKRGREPSTPDEPLTPRGTAAAQELVKLKATDEETIAAESLLQLSGPPAKTRKVSRSAPPRSRSVSPAAPRSRSVSRPRTSQAALTASPEQTLQYHLKADMEHDHSETRPKKSIFAEDQFPELLNLVPNAMGGSLNEDTVRDFFVEGVTPLDAQIQDKKERARLRTRFVMPPESSDFYSAKFSDLFKPFGQATKKEVGVLQDAGIQIYKMMDARNIITYGSILDQAGKPVDDAYYYKSSVTEVVLKPAEFGFDESIVSKIVVKDFNGQTKTCKCIFTINGKERGTTTPILINKRGGDFKSVDEVRQTWTAIKAQKASTGYTDQQLVDAYAAFVGKALGDILLVTSIGKDDPNYPVGKKLTPLGGSSPGNLQIKEVLLNTGDRLNHVRAFIRGVHSMYSSANATTKLRTYEFLPGNIGSLLSKPGPVAQITSPTERVQTIQTALTTVYERYTDLLKHLDTVVPATTQRDGGGSYVPEEKSTQLKAFIDELKITVDALRTYVGFYYLVFYRAHEKEVDMEQLTQVCDTLLREVTFLTPQFSSTVKKSGATLPALVLLRTKSLLYSTYEIVEEDGTINYAQEVTNATVDSLDKIVGSKTIPYKTVHAELAALSGVKDTKQWIPRFPLKAAKGFIGGVLTVRLCDIYNLIGTGRSTTTYEKDIFLFPREAEEVGPMTGGGDYTDIFGKSYLPPTVDTYEIPEPSVDDTTDIQLDLLKDFIGTRSVGDAMREFLLAKQTFKDNPAQCFDTALFEELESAVDITFGELKVREIITEGKYSTSEASQVNAFMCERVKDILDTYITKDGDILCAGSELGSVLTEYASIFRTLAKTVQDITGYDADATTSDGSIPDGTDGYETPGSVASKVSKGSKESAESGPSLAATASLDAAASFTEPSSGSESQMSVGGQRVSAANFIIDTTKSFVK
jgi:hypothetical protein